ncbi:MAG: uroporphyrinogen-III synthase [Neisseria sp.]|uniref:uroporphyrinogen-III synthase n=1 Tax=Neisseria sp. TaxID=192066 RepID=UPI0026DD4DB2|nr:uroporphyrinogen-III synthase [Neisseria sp.]MDO4641146.1 uroporphyrinogen-III synthase [Neisseria sp.]
MPTILLVRPANRAVVDQLICSEAGWHGVPFGVQEILADEAALARLPEDYAAADAVFWVSPSAVQTGIGSLDAGAIREKWNITVGSASAEALQNMGCQKIFAPHEGKDSEAVLRLDVWQNLPPGARVLVIRGHGGRDFLLDALAARGFSVQLAEIYYRVPKTPDWQAFADLQPHAAWVPSADAARLFWAQMPAGLVPQAESLLYFTHHPRIAAVLKEQGAERIELIERFDAQTLNRYTEQADERRKP